jgi:hypothetical protein
MTLLDLGTMTDVCPECNARHWKGERPAEYTNARPCWESCCKKGKVTLPMLNDPPQLLKDLLTSNDHLSKHFLDNIRQCNTVFAFTSFGTTGTSDNFNNGISSLKVHGELYHLQGPINGDNVDFEPSYAQLYIYDPEFAAQKRSTNGNNINLNDELITLRSYMLHNDCDSPFVNIYQHAHEILSVEAGRQSTMDESNQFHVRLNPEMKLELIVGNDRRTHNLPTANEVAIIVPNEYNECSFRDILITYRGDQNTGNSLYKRINETHATYMPLHYVLLFPMGDYGWNWGLRLGNVSSAEDQDDKRPTQRAFYRFRLHQRGNEFSTLFYSKRLFQQYIVDLGQYVIKPN